MSWYMYLILLVALTLLSSQEGDHKTTHQDQSRSTTHNPFRSAFVPPLQAPRTGCYDAARNCFHNGQPGCVARDSYTGTRSQTVNGIACQEWANQFPHRHAAIHTGPRNYCRNPAGDTPAPWCFTMDKGKKWDYCFKTCPKMYSEPTCYDSARNCFRSGQHGCTAPESYAGSRSQTINGVACQEWANQFPHKHKDMKAGPKNYCRITSHKGTPWCYTVLGGIRWDYCFKVCPRLDCYDAVQDCYRYGEPGCDVIGAYTGGRRKTAFGILCQEWAAQSPHKHNFTGPQNYCRNPDGKGRGPWCYTTDKSIRWDFCFKKCPSM